MSRIHVDDRDAVLRTMHGALASRESCEIEFRFTCRDGSVRWITSRGKIVQDPEGRANRIIGVYVDTTDRKLQDLQMRTHQEQLAHLSRVSLLGELSGALAHELNQPLAAILLNAQAACNEIGKPDPDMREIAATLDDIVADDRRAGEVIRKLRALFLRGAVQVRPVSVNECIGEVLALEHTHLIARKATVDVRLDATLPLVLADRVQLQQVLLNLIVNACDAMASNEPADRRIRIESMRGEPGEILVHVRDNGDGVSNTEAIFQPFYSTKDHGLGLGLAVSRTIISAQRGRLWATQNASRGATFHIALPEAREEPERNG